MALVRKRTIPTERQKLVGEVSANFCGLSVLRGQRIPTAVNIGFLDPDLLLDSITFLNVEINISVTGVCFFTVF
jgi:hypothetical protein